jgi:hypothetical protein
MYHPKVKIENPLEATEIEVNTSLIIKGTGAAKNSI